jgi:inorganic pyrophosphatase
VAESKSFPAELEILVELSRFGLIKRAENGRIELLSPLPCPFNYGGVPGTRAADGDREDVILLGPRVSTGSRVRAPVVGRVEFIDASQPDGKWICAYQPLETYDRVRIELFFRLYALVKRVFNLLHGRPGPTRYVGFERAPAPELRTGIEA